MVKNRTKKFIITSLIIMEIVAIFLSIKSFNNRPITNTLNENKIKRKQFSMFVENEDGEYEEYKSSNLFPFGYKVNLSKSTCVDNKGLKVDGALSGNHSQLTVTSNKTIFCYVYFDLLEPSVKITVSTDGTNGTLPTYNHYKQTLTCDTETTSTFNTKYQRIEISNVGKTNTTCNLNYTNDTSTYTLLKTKVESDNTTNNNGYRYSGKEPNNWVWFNDEKWRIIGSIPVCTTSGCGTSNTRLVKIIRAASIGGLAYDVKTSVTGVWGNNTLYTLLNTKYYGKVNATETDYCVGSYSDTVRTHTYCDYSSIGISNDSTDYYGRMVKNVYWNTGAIASSSTASSAYISELSKQTVRGRIGLLNASDFGYAGTDYSKNLMDIASFSTTVNSNWLFGFAPEWINGFISGENSSALVIYGQGGLYNLGVYMGISVRPVLYLDSSVYIISGNGTENNPFVLGM